MPKNVTLINKNAIHLHFFEKKGKVKRAKGN